MARVLLARFSVRHVLISCTSVLGARAAARQLLIMMWKWPTVVARRLCPRQQCLTLTLPLVRRLKVRLNPSMVECVHLALGHRLTILCSVRSVRKARFRLCLILLTRLQQDSVSRHPVQVVLLLFGQVLTNCRVVFCVLLHRCVPRQEQVRTTRVCPV